MMMSIIVLFLGLLIGTPVLAQTPALEITLEHDSEAERATREQLRRIVARYDISKWILTTRIRIDETQIPHSHPVLTVHTRHLGGDASLLSTFVHEQFHWFASDRPEVEAAIRELRTKYPYVPVGGSEGARDERSTYLHLIVCDMELQAMTKLLGEARARALTRKWTHYTWIYGRVLDDPAVREITRRHGLVPPS